MSPIPGYTPGGGGVSQDDVNATIAEATAKNASEIASAINSSYINVSGTTELCDASRDWTQDLPGGEFASFDAANNQLKALQAGRYRFTTEVNADYKSSDLGAEVEVGLQVQVSARDPFASSVFAAPVNSTVDIYSKAPFSLSRVVDMDAGDVINMRIYSSSTPGTPNVLIEPDQGVGLTYMQLEYLGPTPA